MRSFDAIKKDWLPSAKPVFDVRELVGFDEVFDIVVVVAYELALVKG
jgi:hypothetical protein